jgi:peptidoglycan biosynthesis protein MviN/MurJ (putative lipid II flippase)
MKASRATLIPSLILGIITAIVAIFANLVAYSIIKLQPGSTSIVYIILIVLTVATIVAGVLQILPRLSALRKAKSSHPEYPIKITLELDGIPITIETPDLQRVEEIMKLAQRINANHSSIAVEKTPQRAIKESEGPYQTDDSYE